MIAAALTLAGLWLEGGVTGIPLIGASSAVPGAPVRDDTTGATDASVIGAALRELFTVREHAVQLSIWADRSVRGTVFTRLHAIPSAVQLSSVREAFALPVDSVSLGDLSALFREHPDGWEAYFAQHPASAGIVELGVVQYDRAAAQDPGGTTASRERASLLVGRTCGEHCAVAWRVTLQRAAASSSAALTPARVSQPAADAWTVEAITNVALPPETPHSAFVAAPDLRVIGPDAFAVLDVRGRWAFARAHLPGAVRVNWLDYRDGWGRTGRLPSDLTALAAEVALLGVDQDRPVVVYGDAGNGWGEEGRIAWMLRYLGHPDVSVLDGGYDAWVRAGGTVTRARVDPAAGRFVANAQTALRASEDDVAAVAAEPIVPAAESGTATTAILLDTRSDSEWNGSRKYFPSRTGRIPGAVHLRWQDLLTPEGTLDRSPAAIQRLRALGITPDRPVITYCVGGVRSAFVALALQALGVRDVRNYDGSWYEWSANDGRPVEMPE